MNLLSTHKIISLAAFVMMLSACSTGGGGASSAGYNNWNDDSYYRRSYTNSRHYSPGRTARPRPVTRR